MIESTFIPWLAVQPSITALVGTRIFRAVAPATSARPYVTWQVITSDSDHTHDGVSFRDHQVQLSIFSEAAATGDQIRDAFLTLLDGKRLQIPGIDEATSFLESVDHLYEADTKLHHTAITIEVSIAE